MTEFLGWMLVVVAAGALAWWALRPVPPKVARPGADEESLTEEIVEVGSNDAEPGDVRVRDRRGTPENEDVAEPPQFEALPQTEPRQELSPTPDAQTPTDSSAADDNDEATRAQTADELPAQQAQPSGSTSSGLSPSAARMVHQMSSSVFNAGSRRDSAYDDVNRYFAREQHPLTKNRVREVTDEEPAVSPSKELPPGESD